jgi:uncharacterized membrane protein
MLKKVAVFAVVAVAVVVAVQVLLREGPPPSLVVPPRMELPGLDSGRARSLPQPEERTTPERGAATAPDEGAHGPAALASPEPRKFQRRFMFDCGDVRLFVRIGEGEAALLPDGSLTGHWIPLRRRGSEWRGRYANEELVFRPNGDIASFVVGDRSLEKCVAKRDRAALAEVNGGVFLQAFGHDPRWTFEITEHELALTTDGGARRVDIPLRAPIDNGGKMTFRSVLGTQEMIATVDRIPCYDAASGESHELTIAMMFDSVWYYGCGRRISYR